MQVIHVGGTGEKIGKVGWEYIIKVIIIKIEFNGFTCFFNTIHE